MTTRLIIADDHPIFTEGLKSLLKLHKNFKVEGIARNGEEALALVRKIKPDLVIMDIRMPGQDGIEATRKIKKEFPDTNIIILTFSDYENDLFEAVKAGANGYLLKTLAPDEVLNLLIKAANGEAVFTPSLASRVLLSLGRNDRTERVFTLTDREREVLQQLAEGHSNEVIAEKLGIKEVTVRFHLKNILDKLHAQNRTQAVIQALKKRLIRLVSNS